MRPIASLSVDLDDLWTYLKARGDPTWTNCPSFLSAFVPMALELFARHAMRTTFFVVGRDAALPENLPILREIPASGHEVGNHSFAHDPWLNRYSAPQLAEELRQSEAAISAATGQHPVGFRAPAFSWGAELLEILAQRGYLYDASLLPTYIGPIARRYYLRSSQLTREQRAQRTGLYGTAVNGRWSTKPFVWDLPRNRSLVELPITTFPLLKLPFHFSYLLFLNCFSKRLMTGYLRTALDACRLTRTEPSFLLHPLDVLGCDLVPQLSFLPWMRESTARKYATVARLIEMITDRFALVPLKVHAAAVRASGRAKQVSAPARDHEAQP